MVAARRDAAHDEIVRDEDMEYSAADVKRLREQTGAGMLDCRNALVEAADYEGAVEILRVKGAKDVTKRAERTAANGLVTAGVEGNNAGWNLTANCGADFAPETQSSRPIAADIPQPA